MKKNTIKAVFLASFIFGGVAVMFGQTPDQKEFIKSKTNVKVLNALAKTYKEDFETKKSKALEAAKINNWPTVLRKDDGMSVLVDISDEGKPIYLSTYNAGSAITSRTNHLQPGGSLGLNLTGLGMEVGMWDGGYPRSTHVDLVNRFTVFDGSGFPYEMHPTHVLGTIMGGGNVLNATKGMASEATGIVYNYENDLSEMAIQASEGLILSNHSYGLDASNIPNWVFGAYISLSQAVDEITFNAPYYLPVFSAGNDGNFTYGILTDRSVAKNAISVGATYQVNNYSDAGSVIITDFSSWGPTDDNRIKPDIVTKGLNVRSCSSASDTGTHVDSGTSMSAPGITGSLVLLQQHYSNLNQGFMTSATLRGLVAHSADEAGGSDGPDPIYGWGLMNSKRAAEIISAKGTGSIINEMVLMPGQTYTKDVLALGSEPLIATLSWTDPAGPANNGVNNLATPVLINDLDIKVTKSTDTYYPWKFDADPNNPALKGDNNVDNIEKVEINNADASVYTITITHKGTTLSNPGGTPSQAYSLIVSGIDATYAGVEERKASSFVLWPNPVDDFISINLNEVLESDAKMNIYDMQGRLVLSYNITGSESTFSTQSLNAGVYLVDVKNGNSHEVKKIIKR